MIGLGLSFFSYLTWLRVFHEATLLSVGDLTSASETQTNIISQWGPIDVPCVGYVLYAPRT